MLIIEPEELEELGRHVEDVGRALRGAEHGGVLTRLGHVRVLYQGVVAGPALGERDLRLLEEHGLRLRPQPREGRRALGQRQAPEFDSGQIDPALQPSRDAFHENVF